MLCIGSHHPSGTAVVSAAYVLGGRIPHNESSVQGHESFKKDGHCLCNITLNHVCETVVAMEKQKYKIQVQFTLEQAMKAQKGSRGTALLFL
jgi:hypothetical protein